MTEQGTITWTDGKTAKVTLEMHDACNACVNQECSDLGRELTVSNPEGINISVGDVVEFELAGKKQLKSAFFIFALPMLFFILVYGAFRIFFPAVGEGWAALGGIIGFAFGFFIGVVVEKRNKGRTSNLPAISGKVSAGPIPFDENPEETNPL